MMSIYWENINTKMKNTQAYVLLDATMEADIGAEYMLIRRQ
jgi:hypothetical protein